jgi:GTP-binding protein YchF
MLSVGLVGLPNAGKSTLFNLLTKRSVPAENYPFTTIDPHDGVVEVPDYRIGQLSNLSSSKKQIYAAIEFRDIAGLIKNAHKGEGLGNQFLGHIQEVDMILMVVRCFKNDDIIHVENRVNPAEDDEILLIELTLHDEKRLETMIARLEKDRKDPHYKAKIEIIEHILSKLTQILPASEFVMDKTWDEELIKWRKSLNLLTDKPILRLANISYEGDNESFKSDFEIDIAMESQFEGMTKEERQEFGASGETAIDQLIAASYKKLGLGTYLTTGETETRAWTFTVGMKAPQCAGKIHTDFEKKFIKAEVVSFMEYIRAGSWKNAFEAGLVKTMGKDYVFEDGDVVEFKIGG